jgi:hypothetical protein
MDVYALLATHNYIMNFRLQIGPRLHRSQHLLLALESPSVQIRNNNNSNNNNNKSVALVSERTTQTERPTLVVEVSANFCGYRMSRDQRNGSLRQYSRFSKLEPLIFLPSSSKYLNYTHAAEWTAFQTQFILIKLYNPFVGFWPHFQCF